MKRHANRRQIEMGDVYRGLSDPMLLALKAPDRNAYFRQWVYARDNGRCGVCGKPVDFDKMELDHAIPRDLGGEDHVRNLQISHMACNRRKKNKLGELRPQRDPKPRKAMAEKEPMPALPEYVMASGMWTILVYQGRTMRWLASRTGHEYSQVCRWKRGLDPIPSTFAHKAASAIQMPVWMLFAPSNLPPAPERMAVA